MSYGLDGNNLATFRMISKGIKTVAPSHKCVSSGLAEMKSRIDRRRAILKDIAKYSHSGSLAEDDKELFYRLTAMQSYRAPYSGPQYGELFIHWFYSTRSVDTLSRCEVFHLNLLQYYNVMNKVEVLHIRCASNTREITASMQAAIDILSSGKTTVDFKIVPQKSSWEHDTIQEAAEYSVSSGKYVYYTHFKGVSRFKEQFLRSTGREHVNPIDVMYWCYIMYEGLFSEFPPRHKVIGPIACNRINKQYLHKDLSWSVLPKYQYIGSFQAFDGKTLGNAYLRLGLDYEKRKSLIWWGGRYAVEMFLCLVFLENEVHSIAQLDGTSTAYKMHTFGFHPSLHESFTRLYVEPLSTGGTHINGKVAVCAVARNEDPYIIEWAMYYLANGVSHVYIYDNNDLETDTIRRLQEMDGVTVIPLHGYDSLEAIGFQDGIYRDAYTTYGNLYTWMGFFDIDEFVAIDGDMDIPGFLNQPVFDGTHVVHINWRYYGDNGLVRYEDIPVVDRFKEPSSEDVKYSNLDKCENAYVKSFIRTGYEGFKFDIHSSRFTGSVCRDASGMFQNPSKSTGPVCTRGARVNHYGTKTIEEYIIRRLPANGISRRASGRPSIPVKDRLDWFFNVNAATPEKLEVIKELLPSLDYIPPTK